MCKAGSAECSGAAPEIIDLSQALEAGIPLAHVLPPFGIEQYLSQTKGDVVNCLLLHLSDHTGTHCDSPRHVFPDGVTIDRMPADLLVGPIELYDFSAIERAAGITARDLMDLEARRGRKAGRGSVVLLRTDHSKRWAPTPEGEAYLKDRPFVCLDAAQYLIERQVKAVGLDTGGPDPLGGSLSVHAHLLGHGVPVIESLCNLDLIPAQGEYFFLGFPLKIRGGTGSPIRAVAVSRSYLLGLLGLAPAIRPAEPVSSSGGERSQVSRVREAGVVEGSGALGR